MNQRQSFSFPKAGTFLTHEQCFSASLAVAEFMLKDGNCVIPSMFFDKHKFQDCVKNAYSQAEGTSLHMYVPNDQESDLIEAVGTFAIGSEPAALLINFEIGNIVIIVGDAQQFYFIDLFHGICYVTKTPEYDMSAYIEQYGNSEYTLSYFRDYEESAESAVPSEVVVAPPVAKKPKKAAVPKKVAVAQAN